VPRTRPPYPPEFRVEAVRLIRSSGKPLSEISKDLGVSEQSLRVWVKQADLDAGRRDDGLTSAEQEELRQLRRRVRVLEEEREILKKAALSSLGRPISADDLPADRPGEGTPRCLPAVPRAGCVARGLLRLAGPAAGSEGRRRPGPDRPDPSHP
jgi:transposase